MKRTSIFSYSLIILFLFLSLLGSCSQKEENTFSKSEKEIIEVAYEWLDDNSKATIVNWEKGKVEKYKDDKEHIVATKTGAVDIKGKDTYKISFKTNNKELLGPITIYTDATNFNVIGIDFRQ